MTDQPNKKILKRSLLMIEDEYVKAKAKNKAFHNLHEALAILREEYLEFEQAVFLNPLKNPNRIEKAISKAIQLGAMSLGIVYEFRDKSLDKLCIHFPFTSVSSAKKGNKPENIYETDYHLIITSNKSRDVIIYPKLDNDNPDSEDILGEGIYFTHAQLKDYVMTQWKDKK
jgi:hypothetical protein